MQPQELNTEQGSEKNKGLKSHTIWLMICVAIFYDVLTIFVPTFVGIVAGMHFWLWFALHGISFVTPKRFLSGSAGLLVELFPLTSFLPAWTLTVTYIAHDAKAKKEA